MQAKSAELWASYVYADIAAAAIAAGTDMGALDGIAVQRFVVAAISRRLANPDGAESLDVQVDDARVLKRFNTSDGGFGYLPEWWAWIGLPSPEQGGAFSVTPGWQP